MKEQIVGMYSSAELAAAIFDHETPSFLIVNKVVKADLDKPISLKSREVMPGQRPW
jgi:hypothetical protein